MTNETKTPEDAKPDQKPEDAPVTRLDGLQALTRSPEYASASVEGRSLILLTFIAGVVAKMLDYSEQVPPPGVKESLTVAEVKAERVDVRKYEIAEPSGFSPHSVPGSLIKKPAGRK